MSAINRIAAHPSIQKSIRVSMRASMLMISMVAGSVMAAEPVPAKAPAAAPASRDAMPAVKPAAPVFTNSDPVVPAKAAKPATAAAEPARRTGSDRLNLDTTVVTGNRELPKVLYIVPWKRSDLGELPPQPLNTLLDEVLTPVDRDVFRREVTYYGAMAGTDGATKGPPATSPAASEK